MERLSFRVAEYDAPLDLILHLVSKHKLSIIDIDITSLLDQYMQVIQGWQNQSMEVASEFLETASRLVHMKTVSLLPRHEDEIEQLRRDLSGELMEYRLCKLAAGMLGETVMLDSFVREQIEIDIDPTYTGNHPASVLYEALRDAMGRGARRLPPPRDSFDPIVARPVVSVTTKIFTVLRALRRQNHISLDLLFDPKESRSGLVATFLAVLELIKSKKIQLDEREICLADGGAA